MDWKTRELHTPLETGSRPLKRWGHRCPVNYGLPATSTAVNSSCCDVRRPSLLLTRRTSTDPSPALCRCASLVSLTVKAHASRIRVSVSFFFFLATTAQWGHLSQQGPELQMNWSTNGCCHKLIFRKTTVINMLWWKTLKMSQKQKNKPKKKTLLGFKDIGLSEGEKKRKTWPGFGFPCQNIPNP